MVEINGLQPKIYWDFSLKRIIFFAITGFVIVLLLAAAFTFLGLYAKTIKQRASEFKGIPIDNDALDCTDVVSDFINYNIKLKDESCGVERCHHRGICEIMDSSTHDIHGNITHIDYTYNCNCYGGAWGDKCESSNVCDFNHCNGFSCTMFVESTTSTLNAVCNCPRGYSGNHCEWTPCTPNPCEHGGTCSIVKNGSGFTTKCSCPRGYSGELCTNFRCNGFQCLHGNCAVEANGNPICKCAPGYEGSDCSIKSCDCVHGDCHRDSDYIPSCTCDSNYYGSSCNIHLESSPWIDCTPVSPNLISCQNDPGVCTDGVQCLHGTCSVEPNGPTCKCAAGYEGEYCTVKSCDCVNGVCDRDDKIPYCSCDSGYIGKLCDLELVVASTVNCDYSGTTINCTAVISSGGSGLVMFRLTAMLTPILVYLSVDTSL